MLALSGSYGDSKAPRASLKHGCRTPPVFLIPLSRQTFSQLFSRASENLSGGGGFASAANPPPSAHSIAISPPGSRMGFLFSGDQQSGFVRQVWAFSYDLRQFAFLAAWSASESTTTPVVPHQAARSAGTVSGTSYGSGAYALYGTPLTRMFFLVYGPMADLRPVESLARTPFTPGRLYAPPGTSPTPLEPAPVFLPLQSRLLLRLRKTLPSLLPSILPPTLR